MAKKNKTNNTNTVEPKKNRATTLGRTFTLIEMNSTYTHTHTDVIH